jgi:hypothetical protein
MRHISIIFTFSKNKGVNTIKTDACLEPTRSADLNDLRRRVVCIHRSLFGHLSSSTNSHLPQGTSLIGVELGGRSRTIMRRSLRIGKGFFSLFVLIIGLFGRCNICGTLTTDHVEVPVQTKQDLHQVTQHPRCVPHLPLHPRLSLSFAVLAQLVRCLQAPGKEGLMRSV